MKMNPAQWREALNVTREHNKRLRKDYAYRILFTKRSLHFTPGRVRELLGIAGYVAKASSRLDPWKDRGSRRHRQRKCTPGCPSCRKLGLR